MLTTGEVLKRERLNKKLTLEDVEKETRIRKKNLLAIEENDWLIFPSKTYIIGVIKSYGKFLGLDTEKLSAFFRREFEQKEEIRFKTRVPSKYLTPEARRVFMMILTGIFVVFGIYFGFQIYRFIIPPKVTILQPKKTEFKREEKIELVGRTEKDAIVNVNGERAFLDDKQIFSIMIPLTKEKNEVRIEVTGANGKKTIIKKIYFKK